MNDSLESRVARLEERLAWFERHATEQDRAMLELTELAERLRQEVLVLRERISNAGSSRAGDDDERPPHY